MSLLLKSGWKSGPYSENNCAVGSNGHHLRQSGLILQSGFFLRIELESIFEVWTKVPTSYKHICFLLLCMNLILLGAEVFKIEQWYCVLCVKMPYLTLLSNNSRETLESSVVISKTWKWQFVNCSVTSVISISCTPDVNLKMMVHV